MTKGEDLAFPAINPANNEGHSGMSKREYFAAMAMQGTLSQLSSRDNQHLLNEAAQAEGKSFRQMLALNSVKYADALIKELNKKENEVNENMMCLGKTKNGSPRHPLYVKKDTKLEYYFKESP